MFNPETGANLKTQLIHNPEGEHNPVVSWSGVSCSGKDWLLEKTLASLDLQPPRVLGQGELIGQIAKIPRDLIRTTLSDQRFRNIRMETLDLILNGEPTILNAHVLVKHQGRLMVTEKFEKALNPRLYVVVVAPPEEIADRRQMRNSLGGRQSDIETVEQINDHQTQAIKRVEKVARVNKSGFAIVFNTLSQNDENLNFLNKLLSSNP